MHLGLHQVGVDNLDATLENWGSKRQEALTQGGGDRGQALEQREQISVVVLQKLPLLNQAGHQKVNVLFLVEGVSNAVGKSSDGVVQNEQVLLLVGREGVDQSLENAEKVWNQGVASLLLQGSESTASGLLNTLVVVADHAQKTLNQRNEVDGAILGLGGEDAPAGVTTQSPAGDGTDQGLGVLEGLDEVGDQSGKVGLDSGHAALSNSSQGQDTALSVLPLGVEELGLEEGQEDIEHGVSIDSRKHIQGRCRALAEVPLHVDIVLIIIVLIIILIIVIQAIVAASTIVGPCGSVLGSVSLGVMEARFHVLNAIGNGGILVVVVKSDNVELAVDHALEKDGDNAVQVRAQVVGQGILLSKGQPELASLQCNRLVVVLGRVKHVLDNVVDLGNKLIGANLEQHDHGLAHMLANIGVVVVRKLAQTLDKRVDIDHEGLRLSGDELVDASQSADANGDDGRLEVGDDLGDHEVEGSLAVDLHVELVAGILANLDQGLERTL